MESQQINDWKEGNKSEITPTEKEEKRVFPSMISISNKVLYTVSFLKESIVAGMQRVSVITGSTGTSSRNLSCKRRSKRLAKGIVLQIIDDDRKYMVEKPYGIENKHTELRTR